MKWLRLSLRGMVVGAVVVALGAWLLWPLAIDRLRGSVEQFASRELHLPVRLTTLSVSLLPPVAHAEGFEIGPAGAALRVARVEVRLDLLDSLAHLGPVGDVAAEDVWVDPDAFPRPRHAEEGGRPERPIFPFPFQARAVRIHGATVRVPVPGEPLMIYAREVTGQTQVRGPARRMSLDGTAAGLRLWRGAADVALESAHVKGAHTARGIEAETVELRAPGLTVRGGVAAAEILRHEVRAELPVDRLGLIDAELAKIRGTVRLEAALSGPLFDPEVELRAESGELAVGAQTLANVSAHALRRGRHVEATLDRAEYRGATLSARGQLEVSGPLPYSVDGAWSDLDPAAAVGGRAADVLGTVVAEGRLGASGTLKPLSLAAEGGGAFTPTAAPEERVSWQGNADFREGAWRGGATLRQGKNNRASASVSLGRDGTLGGEAEAHVAETVGLRALFRSADIPAVAGAFEATARLSGSLDDPAVSVTMKGRNVGARGVFAADVDVALAYRARELRLERAGASVGGGRVEAAGRVALDGVGGNDWRVELRDVSGDAVVDAAAGLAGVSLPLWRGKLSGTLQGKGTWTQPELAADLRLDEVRVWKEPFASVRLAATAKWPEWQGTLRVQHLPEEWVEAQARGRGVDEVRASVYGTIWNLDRLRGASTARLGGTSWVAAEIYGPLASTQGAFAFSAENLRLRGRRFGEVHTTAWGTAGRWRFEGRALNDALQLDGEIEARGDVPFSIDATWQGADLAALAGAETLRATSSGHVSARGAMLRPRQIEGEMAVEELVIEEAAYRLEARTPLKAKLEKGRLSLVSFRMEGTGGSHLELAGGWTIGGDGDLRIDGEGNLTVAELLFARVRSARGTFRVAADVVRPAIGELRLSGEGTVENATLDFGAGAPLTDAYARLSLAGSQIRIDAMGGHAGGGSFDVAGKVDVFDGPDLQWSAREVGPGIPNWLELEVSGRGTLRGRWDELTLAGDVEVERMLYDQPVNLVDMIPWLRSRLARPADREPSAHLVRLDLRVKAPDELYVDNNVAKVEMRADMNVAGTADKPQLAGSVDVLTGQVTFRDRVFTITGGGIQFRPELGLNPTLDFLAETTVETQDASYTVTAQVSGTADNYRVELSSPDPALSTTDVASLVAFGQTTSQMQQGGAGFSGADLLSLGVGASSDTIERQAKVLLPVDRIKIEPAVSRTTRTFEPRVSVGKNFGEDITVSVASSLGVESYRTVQLEYRLTPGVSLLGSWESETEDKEGAFGGVVKFHREFRRLPRFSLLRSLWASGDDGARGD